MQKDFFEPRQIVCGAKTLKIDEPKIMGILNVTPDSFSDGGKYNTLDKAMQRSEQMLTEGAHIIDVGGESTRPGAEKVSLAEELDRVIPVVEAINKNLDCIISVDTSQPQLMLEAQKAGANIINDVRSLALPNALQILKQIDLPICIMHIDQSLATMDAAAKTSNEDYLVRFCEFFDTKIAQLEEAGIAREKIIIDPGFGFAKDSEQNKYLLNNMHIMQKYDMPILVALSRKRFLGDITGFTQSDERDSAGIGANILGLLKGGHIFRVHNVKDSAAAIKTFWQCLQTTSLN